MRESCWNGRKVMHKYSGIWFLVRFGKGAGCSIQVRVLISAVISRKEMIMGLEDVYIDFQFLAKRHNRTSELSEDLASMFFLEYLEGGYSLPRLSPQYRGFVKKRCMRQWTKGVRQRDGLKRLLLFLKIEGTPNREFSHELIGLLKSSKGKLTRFLIEGYDRREIAEKMGRSVGWVQKEISRLLMLPEMQTIIARHKKIIK